MRKSAKGIVGLLLLAVFFFTACNQKTEYQKLVERELATNVRQDSLFLGIHFRMPSKDFFTHCWELNKKGILTNGTGSQVKYDVSKEFKDDTQMLFYPKFVNDKIIEMPVDFRYSNWALWNEDLSVEVLLEEVKALLDRWYGEGFIKMVSEDGSKVVWVKVDGNRRIRVYRKNISTVAVVLTDLLETAALKPEKS